jgi:hypothetical protein
MSNTLNIGLIGAGFMGQTHAEAPDRACGLGRPSEVNRPIFVTT